ncbi:hypothetical protein LV82_00465 [Albidovulum inexpectatum]|uniref:Uncharacterized protein n=2 Tax=Albidovulum inexpectatum TaxID=196587 RepID=A0A2S5JM14_9RHOB|nr:hypothetical protein LV82_00465 [Albidovulum inexpectatum]
MTAVEVRQGNDRLVLGPAQRVDVSPKRPDSHEASSSVDAAIAELEQAVASGALQLLSSETSPESRAPATAQDRQDAREDTHRLTLSDPTPMSDSRHASAQGEDPGAPRPDDTTHHFDPEDEADAALLREIVADLVRQELQGPLGQKITRSVRMLVHREVNRILAARGLE